MQIQRRVKIATPKLVDKRKKLRRRRVYKSIMYVLLVCALFGAFAWFEKFLIGGFPVPYRVPAPDEELFAHILPPKNVHGTADSSIEITGTQVILSADIRTKVEQILAGRYLWFIPKSNMFFYPKDEIRETLSQTWPRIQSLDIEIPHFFTQFPPHLSIRVHEKTPKYTWCGQAYKDFLVEEAQKCFFVDDSGKLFAEAPYFSGNVYFKLYGLLSATTSPIGQTYMEHEERSKLLTFADTVEAAGFIPDRIFAKGVMNGANSHEYEMLLRDRSRILFSIESIQNREKIAAGLAELAMQGDFTINDPSSTKILDYIDVRFVNKVYYKLKQPSI